MPPRPTLVLLPGLACDAALWPQRAALLAAGWDVRVSDAHTRADTLPAMAAALLEAHPGPLVLAGSSMGGMLALHAALAAPGRIHGLALLGTSARADTPEMAALRHAACTLFEAGRMDEVLRANVPLAFHPVNAGQPTLVAEYLAMVRRAGAAQLVRQNRAVAAREDLRPRLGALRCPALVLSGEADQLTPPECARELAAGIAGARLELLPACGHLPTLERPALVAALLLEWLDHLAQPPQRGPQAR